jgi:hypothetical protein
MTAEMRTEAGDPVANAFAWVDIDTGTKEHRLRRTGSDA